MVQSSHINHLVKYRRSKSLIQHPFYRALFFYKDWTSSFVFFKKKRSVFVFFAKLEKYVHEAPNYGNHPLLVNVIGFSRVIHIVIIAKSFFSTQAA